MRASVGGWARCISVLVLGAVLLFSGCAGDMMGEKKMMDKDMAKDKEMEKK